MDKSDHQLVHWRIPRDLLDLMREYRDDQEFRPTSQSVAVRLLERGLKDAARGRRRGVEE